MGNPLLEYADLVGFSQTLDAAKAAEERTQSALKAMRGLSGDFQADDATIRRLEIQLGKYTKMVGKARKALSKAARSKVPSELVALFKKESRILKRRLGASLFGTPHYSYKGGSYKSEFIISLPLQGFEDIHFVMELQPKTEWSRNVSRVVGLKTEFFVRFHRYDKIPATADRVMQYLLDQEYEHFPKSDLEKRKEEIAEMERLRGRIPRGYEYLKVDVWKGKPRLILEFNTGMRWEYDQMGQSRFEFDRREEAAMDKARQELQRHFGSKYEVDLSMMGEKGHVEAYISKKASRASGIVDRYLAAGCGCPHSDESMDDDEEAMMEKTSPAPELPPGKG